MDFFEIFLVNRNNFTEVDQIIDFFCSKYDFQGLIESEEIFEKLSSRFTDERIKVFIKSDQKVLQSILQRQLDDNFGKENIIIDRIEFVPNQDWSENWKKAWKAFYITDDIIICPSWENCDNLRKNNEIVITIDPSNAFGTGTHATTMLCAQAIEKYKRSNKTLIDVGCGSGILSIIAAKLDFETVFGIDNDPEVIETALNNVSLNKESEKVIIDCNIIQSIKCQKFDVIVANILHNIIASDLEIYKNILSNKEDSVIIVSGILEEKSQCVLDKVKELDLEIISIEKKTPWICIIMRRKKIRNEKISYNNSSEV